MFDDGQYARCEQAPRHRAGERTHLRRHRTESPVSDHSVGAGDRQVRDRRAVHVDADRAQLRADQPPAEFRRGEPPAGIGFVKRRIGRGCRIGRPMRRRQPLHPAALLIYEDGRVPADGVAKLRRQSGNLRRIVDIAPEQDQAPGRALPQERFLLEADAGSGESGDERARRHGAA